MNRILSRMLCGCLVPALLCLFTGCSETESTGTGYLFTYTMSEDPDCLDPQYSDHQNAAVVIANTMEGLLRPDPATGEPLPAGAESYTVSENGLTYMFNLRDDCFWYRTGWTEEQAVPVTAQDYVYAFRRLFDPATQSPYAEDFLCLKNAGAILAGTADYTTIGISAPDPETVIFKLEYPNAEFPKLVAQPCAVPCNEEFFLSTNGRYGLDLDTSISNGPFYMTKWNYDAYGSDNFITFRKSPVYYDKDAVAPAGLTFRIQKTQQAAEESYAAGTGDILLTNTWSTQYENEKNYVVTKQQAETLGLIFNPQNETLQSDTLRTALACGIDRTVIAAQTGGDLQVAYGVIPPGARMLGRSYRDLYADKQLALPYDPAQAAALFSEAAEELGLYSLNTFRILVSSEITDTDALLALCQEWQDLFGYYIGIETVTPTEFRKRIAAGDYSIALYPISADTSSCYDVLHTFNAQSELLGFESEAFTALMPKLSTAKNLSDALPLYGEAEQAIIDSLDFIPLYYKNTYLICTTGNTDIGMNAFTDVIYFRDAKHFS